MHLWNLPGPGHFLDQAMAALREGSSVLIPVPLHGMHGLSRALEQKLHVDGWDCHSVRDEGGAPVEQIFATLCLDDGGSIRRTVSLLRQCLKPGQIVLIHGVRPSTWSAWKQFLDEYELASRGVGTIERPLVVLLTEGVSLREMPERGAALRVLECENVIGEIDVLLFTTSILRNGVKADYKLKLMARMICRLALWDLDVARFLTERKPDELLDPKRVLSEAILELGLPDGLTRTWESGGIQRFDDVECAHPFIVVSEGDVHQELMMRLWAAQAAEVLPALELQRRSLVRRMRGLITMPVVVDGIKYDDLDDMEIGPLSHVAHINRLSNAIRLTANKLKRLRNSLAHLEVLGATDVFDEALYRHNLVDR
ncbi:hypothetical protein WJ12_29855 [Burkholderia seminalis]|nr:hypothetical protein WJ12_29855 [Burkholderia seminalis]KVF51910.1 hypothetical protein WJ13_07930 [Burkholderia seminalis]